jgi:hypothetical protein
MSFNYEQDVAAGVARSQALLEEAAAWRLARANRPARAPLLRNGARLIGRGLVGLGALLMRYGRSEQAVVIESNVPAPHSVALN